MSFFGLPDRSGASGHNRQMPGFGQAPDHFAGLSSKATALDDDDDGYDFEDTYDGLGDELDERDDAFNDDTFGAAEPVGKDFDFYGSTAKVANAINEEHMIFNRQAPKKVTPAPKAAPKPAPKPASKPAPVKVARPVNTPALKSPEPIPDLQPEMSLWSNQAVVSQPKVVSHYQQSASHAPSEVTQPPPQLTGGPTKILTLEEVEAQILALSQKLPQSPPPPKPPTVPGVRTLPPLAEPPQLQHYQPEFAPPPLHQPIVRSTAPQPIPQFLHEQQQRHPPQTLHPFNQNRQPPHGPLHIPGMPLPMPGMQQQMHQPSEAERAKMMEEESKRLKRNLKIAQLARYNGLMTPNDKNFIQRIQLQQLVSVSEDSFAEDFYYQVHSAIRARNYPQQPLNQFAQTYLFQQGHYGRGKFRRQDNHMHWMEQQVQRAVAAAKARPKASQLVLEGSLGKISFSNVKTPRPMLSIHHKAAGEHQATRKPGTVHTGANKKALLRAIENIYDTLLDLEMHERVVPQGGVEHIEWQSRNNQLVAKLWKEMKIMEPIDPNSSSTHPFIAILSYAKGKKAIPRVFRHIDPEQRVTILTMIVVHLSHLDVVKGGIYHLNETQLPSLVREEIELFLQTVLPPLLGYVSEAPLDIVMGLLAILLERVDVVFIAKTKIGLAFLTMLTSRAEIIKQGRQAEEAELNTWAETYDRLFVTLEPHFLECFPPANNFVDDVYVWQFLASMAVGANMSQQQRLVTAVKDRVMENVMASKALPPDVGAQKSANVNLFMRAIGLDVELLR